MDDKRLETMIGELLRGGVLLAAATVFAGGALYLAQHNAQLVNYHTFVATGPGLGTLRGICRAGGHLNPEGLIQFGLLLLIATPIARVVMAMIGFALERDRLYAAVSLIVLAILVFSLMHAA